GNADRDTDGDGNRDADEYAYCHTKRNSDRNADPDADRYTDQYPRSGWLSGYRRWRAHVRRQRQYEYACGYSESELWWPGRSALRMYRLLGSAQPHPGQLATQPKEK